MSDVLDYVRSRDARFAEVPDQDLTLYLGQRAPEFLADPEFKAQFTQFAAEKSNAQYKQATGFNMPGFDPYATQRSSLGGVAPGTETVTGAPAEPTPKPQLSTEQEAAGATLDMIPISSVPSQFKGDVMAWQNRNLPIPDSMKAPQPDPHKVLSGLVEDWAVAVGHNFTQPMVNPDEIYPFSKEDRELIKLLPWPFKASDAVLYRTAQMISGFTSASGANELMAASLSGPIGTAGKLYFAIEGAKAAPQALSNLMDEAAKPPEQRDAGNIAGNLFDLGMSGLMMTGGLHGGRELVRPKPEAPLTPEQQKFAARSAMSGGTAAGNEMVYKAIGQRVGIEPEVAGAMSAQRPAIEQRIEQERTQAEADRQAELQRGVGLINQIQTREPASVPETAPEAERDLTVLQEIRQAGARTKKQIQRLFPQRGLSNQEAARLRDAAWNNFEEAPAGTSPTAPAQPGPKANEAKPGAVETPAPGGPKIESFGIYRGEPDRPMVIVKVGDTPLVFYRSSKGTSGKIEGNWYPMFGIGAADWIIKGPKDYSDTGYGRPAIKEIMDQLNQRFAGKSPDEVTAELSKAHGAPMGARQLSILAYGKKGHSPDVGVDKEGQIDAATGVQEHILSILGKIPKPAEGGPPAPPFNKPVPNENGVYKWDNGEQIDFENKRVKATAAVLQVAPGQWTYGIRYDHKTGSHQGHWSGLTDTSQTFPSRVLALGNGLADLIAANKGILEEGSSTVTENQKRGAQEVIDWAYATFEKEAPGNRRPLERVVTDREIQGTDFQIRVTKEGLKREKVPELKKFYTQLLARQQAKLKELQAKFKELDSQITEPQPQPEPQPETQILKPAKGAPFTASTPVEGVTIKGNYDVVEEGELKTSFDAGYDPKLQPRDRSRQASANQIAEMVRRFQPARLGSSLTSDLGAPFVDDQGQVTSGNGRVTAIRSLYDAGQGGNYKDWLIHNAKEFGLAPEGIGVMDRPVLVRRVSDYGELSKEQFAEQSNRQQVLGKSEAEKAASDAKMLESNPKLLESFAPDEEGNVLAAGNRPFLNAFIQGTGDQAELLTKDGYNGAALIKRVKNAVLGALIGPEDRTLLNQLIEGADELNLRHAVNGTMSAAPGLMRFKGTAYDLSGALAQALKDLVSLRTTGQKLHDFLTSKPLFTDPNRTAQSDALLQSLAGAGSAKRIAEPLNTYARGAAEALQDAQAGGMFGTRPATREEIISRIYGERNGQTETTNQPLGKPKAGGGPGGPAPGPENPAAPGQPKIFTNDAAEAARQRLRDKLKGTNILVDPTILADVVVLAGNVIERGAIKYADYVREMLKELGEDFRPYFKAAYNQVREYTEAAKLKRLMSPRAEIEQYENQNANQPGGAGAGGAGPDQPTGTAGGGPELAGAVRGGGGGGRPGIVVVDEGDIPAARPIVRAGQYKGPTGDAIDETQRLAINLALTRFEDGGDAFLLGDGTGVGKTGTQLVIGVETAKRTGKPTLIVTQNRSIIENQFKAQAQKFGIPTDKLHFATYDDLSRGNVPEAPSQSHGELFGHKQEAMAQTFWEGADGEARRKFLGLDRTDDSGRASTRRPWSDLSAEEKRTVLQNVGAGGKAKGKGWGLVIFDEAHNLKNAGSARSFRSQLIEADHRVFATATPMDSPTHAAYFLAQITGKTREQVASMLGYKFVTRTIGGQEREFVELEKGNSWAKVIDHIKELRNKAVSDGTLIRREYPFYGQANFRNMPDLDGIAKEEQDRIISYWDNRIKKVRSPTAKRNLAGQKTGELSRWLEIQKLPEVTQAVVDDLKAGRKVVVFAEGYNPTLIKGLEKTVPGFLSSLAQELDKRGIKYLKLFEDSAAKKSKAAADFQKGKADVILATPRSGGAGIDLDDMVGNAPRTVHFVTMNFSGDVFDQMLGRVSRRNTASPAQAVIWRARDAFADQRRQQVLDRKLTVLRNIQAGEDLDVNDFVRQADSEGGPAATSSMWTEYGDGGEVLREGPPAGNPEHWHLSDDELQGRIADLEGQMELDPQQQRELENLYFEAEQRGIDTGRGLPEAAPNETNLQGRQPTAEPAGGSQPDLRSELQTRPAAAQGAERPLPRTSATPQVKTPGAEAKRLARAAARARREALRAKRGLPPEERAPAALPNWPEQEEGPLSSTQRYTIASHLLQRVSEIEPQIEKLTGRMAPKVGREPGSQGGKNMASANELAYWQGYSYELREAASILSQPGYEAALNQMVQNHNARRAEFKQGRVAPHRAEPELARGIDGAADALRLIANLLEKPPKEMPERGELPLQVPRRPAAAPAEPAPAPTLRSATPETALSPGEQMQLLEKGTPYRTASSEPIDQGELRQRETQQMAEHLPQAADELQASSANPDAVLPRRKWFSGLRSIFAPQTLDEGAMNMAGIIRSALGKEYAAARRADAALRPFRREFDRTPVGRNWTYEPGRPLPRNYEVMRAIDTGNMGRLTASERSFATMMRRLFDQAIEAVQEVSPGSLRELIENYFPRIWRQKNALDRSRLQQLLSRHPWEGPKSFLKKRVLSYFTDGLEKGLRPISDNPVDVTMAKLGEMYRFAATRRALKEAKEAGLRRFVYIYERPPEGWREVDDPSSSVYKPPVVTIQEAFDAQVRAKTLELLQSLGVPHERLAKIGGKRWGYAEPGTGKIVSKFGGPDFVLWHELGHQMDWRYPELRKLLGEGKLAKELRDLADLRAEGEPASAGYRKYLHQIEEKIANVFDAYIRAPEKFKRTAPGVYEAFDKWLDQHPELGPKVRDIRPSLTLKAGKTDMFIGGPVLLGRWMMPEGAAQVADNYLKPGLGKFASIRTLREVSGLLNGLQLLGFFHGQFVMNDSFYSGIGLALYDVMTGHPARALKEVAQIPISPFTSLYRGYKINQAIAKPEQASAQYRQLGQLAVEQNLRAGHGNYDPQFARRWVRAMHEAIHEPSLGASWESMWRAPFAALETAMKPVMNFLVPHMKQGIMARMSERVLADNPNADTPTLRRKLAEAADATEDRLGQVTYDNLFQARAMKDAGQLAFRAYGWQLTKYRMILGGTADWVRAGAALAQGKKPVVTFRMAYLPAMVMGHALIGSVLQYMLTGKPPQEAKDYLFPKSGLTDAYGQPVRIAIADFVKDVVADWRAFPNLNKLGAEWSRKLAPFWNMAAEMYRNEDFWGTRIFSPKEIGEPALQHVLKSLGEGAAYMANTAQPFSVRAANKFAQAGGGKLGVAAPFLGFVPAPRYATQTAAEARAGEIIRELSPAGGRTREQAEHSQQISELVRDLRSGKINGAGELAQRARAAGVKDKAELTRIQERVLWTPLQYQVAKMPLVQAMEVFDLANEQERLSLAKGLATKIQHAFDGGRLDQVNARRYVQLVMPYYKRTFARPAAGVPPGR